MDAVGYGIWMGVSRLCVGLAEVMQACCELSNEWLKVANAALFWQ